MWVAFGSSSGNSIIFPEGPANKLFQLRGPWVTQFNQTKSNHHKVQNRLNNPCDYSYYFWKIRNILCDFPRFRQRNLIPKSRTDMLVMQRVICTRYEQFNSADQSILKWKGVHTFGLNKKISHRWCKNAVLHFSWIKIRPFNEDFWTLAHTRWKNKLRKRHEFNVHPSKILKGRAIWLQLEDNLGFTVSNSHLSRPTEWETGNAEKETGQGRTNWLWEIIEAFVNGYRLSKSFIHCHLFWWWS